MIGTWAFCSVSGVSPPSSVTPKPTIVSSVVGAHSALLGRAGDRASGALVELLYSLSIEMS